MLKDRLNEILSYLEVSGKSIASYSGFDASVISRIRSGKRVPQSSSSTTSKLINGILVWAVETNNTDKLKLFLKENKLAISDDKLISSIKSFLYSDYPEQFISEESKNLHLLKNPNNSQFSKKLTNIMELTNTSSVKLSRLINVDPSYISRFKNGKRVPKTESKILDDIVSVLFDRVIQKSKKLELTELLNISPDISYNTDMLYTCFKNYLFDFDEDTLSVLKLLKTIDAFSITSLSTLPKYSDIIDKPSTEECNTTYYGIEGLRRASERFLISCIENKYPELWLYSDEDMTWMTGDSSFTQKWVVLMIELLQRGTKVKIIHNIERMLPEMIDGIRSWIPLYMTGNITPYYSLKERGERFAHTLFLAPGKESITACHAKGNEANGLYNYCTVPSSLAYYEKSFEVLINNSEPLAKIITENSNNPSIKLIEEESLPNISIAIGPKSVYIKKMNTPEVSIVFFHPLIRNAFRSFFDDY